MAYLRKLFRDLYISEGYPASGPRWDWSHVDTDLMMNQVDNTKPNDGKGNAPVNNNKPNEVIDLVSPSTAAEMPRWKSCKGPWTPIPKKTVSRTKTKKTATVTKLRFDVPCTAKPRGPTGSYKKG